MSEFYDWLVSNNMIVWVVSDSVIIRFVGNHRIIYVWVVGDSMIGWVVGEFKMTCTVIL